MPKRGGGGGRGGEGKVGRGERDIGFIWGTRPDQNNYTSLQGFSLFGTLVDYRFGGPF